MVLHLPSDVQLHLTEFHLERQLLKFVDCEVALDEDYYETFLSLLIYWEFSESRASEYANFIDWNNRGNAQSLSGNYEEARKSYNRALKIKSDSHEAWNNRGNALYGLERYQEAIASYDKALKFPLDSNVNQYGQGNSSPSSEPTRRQSNDFYPVWYNRGNALYKLGRYEEAIKSYNQALRFKQTEYKCWYNLGNALSILGQHEEAIDSYKQALRFNNNFEVAFNKKGNALQKLGNYEEAENYEQALLKQFYSYAEYNCGNALFHLGRYEDAITRYDKALKFSNYCEAWNNRGNALFKLGSYKKAIDNYNKALNIKSDYFYALYNRANALIKLGKYSEAIDSYDRALEIQKKYQPLWNNKGNILKELGRYSEAMDSYKEALKLDSSSHVVFCNFGNLLSEYGRNQEAIANYEKALNLQPHNHDALYNQGNVLFNMGRYEEAIASYNQALKISPNDHASWNNLGSTLSKLSRYQEAIASYNQALKINPNDFYTLYNRGNELTKLGQYLEALNSYNLALSKSERVDIGINFNTILENLIRYLEELIRYDLDIKTNPNYHKSWYERGLVLYNLGRYEKALDSFDQALKIKSDYHEAWCSRGEVLHKLDRYKEALASLERALEIKSDYHQAWFSRGKLLLYDLDRYEDAVTSFERALLKFSAEDPESLYYLGLSLYKLEQYNRAIVNYKESLIFKPDNYEVQYYLGLALCDLGRSKFDRNEQKVSFDEAIDSFNCALEINNQFWPALSARGWAIFYYLGYEAALEDWKKSLEAIESATFINTDIKSEGCGVLYHDRGRAHYEQGTLKQDFKCWKEAKNDYQKALERLNPEKFCERYLEVLKDAIYVCRDLGEPEKIRALNKDGRAWLTKLLQKTLSENKRIKLKKKFANFSESLVSELAQSFKKADRIKALQEAEQHKNDCLSWLRYERSDSATESPKSKDIQMLLDSRTTAIIYWHISPLAITTFILRYKKDILIWQYNQSPNIWMRYIQDGFSLLRRFFKKVKPNEPIYPPGTRQMQDFEDWMSDWKQPSEKLLKDGQQKDLQSKLDKLNKILNIKSISKSLVGIEQLILIPHRNLHLLPLEALFTENFTIARLPSAQIGLEKPLASSLMVGQIGQDVHTLQDASLLNVENPCNDLPFASVEAEAIAQLYPPLRHLKGEQATKLEVMNLLQGDVIRAIFHFTGHGQHDINQPLESALLLADKKLTLQDIFPLNLSRYYLVCLSACETGMTGKKELIDEFVGLASAFLAVGALHVVSTLWSVNEISTSFLMIKFYENLHKPMPVAVAIKEAKFWLQNITKADLEKWIEEKKLPLDKFQKTDLKKLLKHLSATDEPFRSPYYWAAFYAIGK